MQVLPYEQTKVLELIKTDNKVCIFIQYFDKKINMMGIMEIMNNLENKYFTLQAICTAVSNL